MPNLFAIIFGIIIPVIFLIVISIIWSVLKGAPWAPTSMKKVRKMLEMADLQPDEILYDLGCGDGRIIVMAARKFGAKAVGVEIGPLRFLWCQFLITILLLRKKVKVIYGDLFKANISDADVVVCFLLQSTNYKLEEKLIEELSPETRIVSNTYVFRYLPLIKKDKNNNLFLYKIREK